LFRIVITTVLQAEVVPPLLIRNGRKFHVRTYIVVLEQPDHDDLLDIFIHNRHELRIAGAPVSHDSPADRDPLAHITNGANSTTTERVLLHHVPEVADTNLQAKVETFVATVFAKHLLADISRRVSFSLNQDESDGPIRRFVVAGLDLMVTEDLRIYLLEANVHPAAPPEHTVTPEFREHLTGFLSDIVELVMGGSPPNFVAAREILDRESNGGGTSEE
jgi:Tubulin-tyrosine ligase family